MVRLLRTGYRSTSVPIGTYEPFEFSHIKRADMALGDLNSLTQASRRHDRDFIDDLNAKLIVDSSLGLPPRSVRRHHYYHQGLPSASSHVSRRVHVEGTNAYELPLTSSYARGYSLPPSSYSEMLLADGVPVSRSSHGYGDAKRASLAADTAVRQAHREVSRVERELGLSHYEEPSSFATKHRSYSYHGPREYSLAPTSTLVHHHVPSTYQYHRRLHHLPHYEVVESPPAYRPLYPPEKLVRCLTETPVTRISGRSVDDIVLDGLGSGLRSSSVLSYVPQLHVAPLPPPAPVLSRRSHVVHRLPRYTRSSSVTSSHLPDSVSHWYQRPTTHYYGSSYDLSSPVVTTYHQPLRSHVALTSSSSSSSTPAQVSYGPSPPYHTRVIGEGSFYEHSHADHHVPYFSSWTPAPVYHQTVSRRVHSLAPSTVYVSNVSSLSPSLDKPLESHIEVSEARKKVREVLCKVKKDPTYFD